MKVEDKAKTSLALDKSSYNLSPCEYIKKLFESEDVVTQSCLTLRPHGLQSARLLCPGNSPGKNTRVGCYSLLQGIFLTQGSNPGLLHCRQIPYHLRHQGSPCNYLLQYIHSPFISYPWLIYFASEDLYILISLIYFFPPPAPLFPSNHLIILCVYNSVSALLYLFTCFAFQMPHKNEII